MTTMESFANGRHKDTLVSKVTMQPDDDLKVLLIHDDQGEANRLASLLRNAKYKIDPTHTDSPPVLDKLLKERSWDLVLSQYESTKVSGKEIFQQLRRLNLDLPVLQVCDGSAYDKIAEGMRQGAVAVIPMDEDQVLLHVVARTLYNLEQRRKLRHWKRRYYESENRCQRLLSSCRDAIAIIQEGTYLYTNEAYANLFGFLDPEGMVCLPVIDTVATEDRARLKDYLKPISPEDERTRHTLMFTGITSDTTPVPIECVVSQVEYQNEPALEFLIPSGHLQGGDIAQLSSYDNNKSTASIQRHQTLDHIDTAIIRAAQQYSMSALIYINIDRYQSLQDEIGYQSTEQLVGTLINRLEDHINESHNLDRFKEESLILLLKDSTIDHALELAEHLCQITQEQPLEVDDQTFSITLSIGVSGITEAVTSPEGCIFRCLTAITKLQSEQTEPDYGNGVRLYEADISTAEKSNINIEEHGQALLDKQLFELFYQPIITLHGEPGEFYEVLLRVSPEGNPKDLPEDFIDKLFRTELGGKIDRWVIIESVKVLAEKLKTAPQTKLFVNLSSNSMCDPGFIAWLKVALKASNISPQHLIFQLREMDTGRHQKQATKIIQGLSDINSKVALSHFGLAIDPIQLLKKVQVDYVKFDSVVIEKTQQDGESNLEDIEQIINALKAESANIIVPFVENAAMIPSLWQYGIHYIQGHFLQPPSSEMDFDFNSEN